MKTFWKKLQDKRLEDYLIESIHEKTDFCLSFRQIPNPEFLKMFTKKYENELARLDALKNLDDEDEN
jgi:hypothetical protein